MHTRLSLVPLLEKPAEHVHVVAPEPLVLPTGHAVQAVPPTVGLYVLAPQIVQLRDAPDPCDL